MNYRHAFHAGNIADVLKHVVLARMLEHQKRKPAPFRVVDVHAGTGLYDLTADAAARTLEWREGVGRLYADDGTALPLAAEAEALILPWRKAIAAVNDGTRLARYPGSPEIVRRLGRDEDRFVFNELHPEDHAALEDRFSREPRVRVTREDAWTALRANLPPPERRGLLLIDPPYEAAGETDRALAGLVEAHRRFATGTLALWYPVKGQADANAFARRAAELGLAKTLRIEIAVRRADDRARLNGSGLIIVNPTWPLDEELQVLLPALSERLADSSARFPGGWKRDWLVSERGERLLK